MKKGDIAVFRAVMYGMRMTDLIGLVNPLRFIRAGQAVWSYPVARIEKARNEELNSMY